MDESKVVRELNYFFFSSVHRCLSAFTLTQTVCACKSDWARETQRKQFVHASERKRTRTRATHHGPEVRACLQYVSKVTSSQIHAHVPVNKPKTKNLYEKMMEIPSSLTKFMGNVGQQTAKIDTCEQLPWAGNNIVSLCHAHTFSYS